MPLFLDAAAATALVADGATVLDTRGAASFLARHIPGAVRADWRAATTGGTTSGRLADPATVAATYAALGVDDHRPVLVVGAWLDGWGEEARVAWDLTWLGHKDVHILDGGMDGWSGARAHLPTRARAGALTPRPRPELRTTTAALRSALAGPNPPVVIDVRTGEEYAGATRYGEARGGHIPGARHEPWQDLLRRPPADLPRDTPIVVYCTGGVRSSMAWAALTRHGYVSVTNDDGSWWEWAREIPE
jgi:thiosulfate/3-mercaptopyruvate sulfurtransferase